MKVIVCFEETRITVPCGNGEMLVKDLVHEAVLRYKRATGKGIKVKIRVHTVKSFSDDGILDFNDQIGAVVDDREQVVALFEEDSDDLEINLASDGMSAGSSSTDTWRPDSENSETNGLPVNDAGGLKLTPLALNKNQRWLFERPGLIDEEQNGVEINQGDVPAKSGLTISVRRGSDSNLDNARDIEDEDLMQQPQLKRWSTAAAVYGQENLKSRNFFPLPHQASYEKNLLTRLEGSDSDLSSRHSNNSDCLPTHIGHKPCSTVNLPVHFESSESEEISDRRGIGPVITLIPRPGEPVGLHLVPATEGKGLHIQFIDKNSVAEASQRLRVGDRIVDVNGQRVDELEFQRAQEILRTAVAQGGAVKIRVRSTAPTSSTETVVSTPVKAFSSPSSSSENSSESQPRRKRTPPPLPPKPKLPHDIETMLHRANYEASLDYSPDEANNEYNSTEGFYSYGSLRRPGRKLTIDLLKGPEGLGFTITTRDNPAGSVCPIYVKSILPKGAAFKDGRLKTGDRLMEVNGTDLTGKSQDEVVGLLRGIPYNTEVVLVVGRPETTSPVLTRVVERPSEFMVTETKEEALQKNKEILTFEIPLNDTGSAGLGVRVKGKATVVDGENKDQGIFVMNVITGGAASKDGRLLPMDQLISVNGISLLHQSNQDAMETLRKAMQAHGVSSPVMSITVARDLPREQEHNQSSASRNGTEPLVINHVVRVPSMSNLLSISPQSDISPPKPPRLYQNMPAIPPITISGRTNEPILIEGDDSFAESGPTNSPASVAPNPNHLEDSKDPYDADNSTDYDPFNREGFARQSMSEKRHAHIDPRYLETYRKSKAALAQNRAAATVKSHTPSPSDPADMDQSLRRANSLESVVKGPTAPGSSSCNGRRSKAAVSRHRGCNESFRVAVDRSFEAEREEERAQEPRENVRSNSVPTKDDCIEVLESTGNADAAKKQKKSGLLRSWLRRSGNKKDESPLVPESPTLTQSAVNIAKSVTSDEQAAKAREAAIEEQKRINVHYQRFKSQQLQQEQLQNYQQHPSLATRPPPRKPAGPTTEQRPMIVHIPSTTTNFRITDAQAMSPIVTNDPYSHYMNYDEIQKVIKRKPNFSIVQRQRPVSNFFEYGGPPRVPVTAFPSTGVTKHPLNANIRMGNGTSVQTTRPLGQIRETSLEKLAISRGNEKIYGSASGSRNGRVAVGKPMAPPSASALMGSQV